MSSRRRVLFALSIAADSHSRPAAAQEPTFSSRVDTVRVDVSVRQGGQAVAALTPADFEVLDNGVRQQVDFAALEQMPVNVVLALDMSGSVQGARLAQLRAAGARLVEMLGAWRTPAASSRSPNSSRSDPASRPTRRTLLSRRCSSPTRGVTRRSRDATHAALVLGGSRPGRPLVIVFSDGTDTASFLSPELVLDTARRTGPVVYAVTSVGTSGIDFSTIVVRLTGGRRIEIASLERLSDAFAEILSESRERYLLATHRLGVLQRADGTRSSCAFAAGAPRCARGRGISPRRRSVDQFNDAMCSVFLRELRNQQPSALGVNAQVRRRDEPSDDLTRLTVRAHAKHGARRPARDHVRSVAQPLDAVQLAGWEASRSFPARRPSPSRA